jgi:hypothetical protein
MTQTHRSEDDLEGYSFALWELELLVKFAQLGTYRRGTTEQEHDDLMPIIAEVESYREESSFQASLNGETKSQ